LRLLQLRHQEIFWSLDKNKIKPLFAEWLFLLLIMKHFTNCGEPLKYLNGKMPIKMSIKKDANVASVLKLVNLRNY